MPLVILPVAAIALTLGLGIGWLARGRGGSGDTEADWKTRLAARDRDLHEARQETADLALALQNAQSQSPVAADELNAERVRSEALADRLRSAEAELADTRNLEPDDAGTGSPDLLHRIEELEAELTTLASHRCPDPSVHATPGLMTTTRSGRNDGRGASGGAPTPGETAPSAGSPSDDLTRIAGIGVGLAKVLRSMGIASFEQLAAMDEPMIDRLDDLVGGIRERAERHDWAGAARTLQSQGAVEAS